MYDTRQRAPARDRGCSLYLSSRNETRQTAVVDDVTRRVIVARAAPSRLSGTWCPHETHHRDTSSSRTHTPRPNERRNTRPAVAPVRLKNIVQESTGWMPYVVTSDNQQGDEWVGVSRVDDHFPGQCDPCRFFLGFFMLLYPSEVMSSVRDRTGSTSYRSEAPAGRPLNQH
jgi:hypothetical protein